jgi:hypothetical protein
MPTPRRPDGGHVRASDRDREQVAVELRAHCVDGRLTVEELEHRLDSVNAARTLGDLAEIVHDLPPTPVAAGTQVERRVRVGPPGVRPFTNRIVVPARRARTRALALELIAPALNARGYELTSQSPRQLVFERVGRPGWTIAVAFLMFPLGLFALAHKRQERVVISLERGGEERTIMVIHGSAPQRVRKPFATLTFG